MSSPVLDTDLVVGKVVQTAPVSIYEPGVCDCNVCSIQTSVATCQANDWEFDTRACCGKACPRQPRCSKVNPDVCPTFGGRKAYSAAFNQAPNVDCTYLLDQFNTTEDITKYIATFGRDEQLTQRILPRFCAGTANGTCPASDVPGVTPLSCSRMMSKGQDGTICRAWAAENPLLADNAMTQYCSRQGAIGCDCVNRQDNFYYRVFKQYTNGNPGCWYRPCTRNNNQLIPTDVSSQGCTGRTCAEINAGYQKQQNNVSFADAEETTICPLTPPPPAQTGRTNWALLIVTIVLLIILLVILYFFFTHQG